MAIRTISVQLGLDSAPYVAGADKAIGANKAIGDSATAASAATQAAYDASGKSAAAYAAEVEKASAAEKTAAERADANVAKKVAANAALQEQAAAYKAISDAAVDGSDRQIAADRLLEVANKKLAASGLEVALSQSQIDASTKGLGQTVQGAVGFIENLGLKVQNSGGIVGSALKGITADASAMSVGMTTAGAAVVVALGALAISGVSSYKALGDQTRILMGVTGATAEQASSLIFTFNQIGTSSDTLTLSFARFGKNIQDMPSKFDALGVSIAHTQNGAADVFGTFENLKTTFDNTSDAATRDAIVMDLLGRGASGLIPYLRLTTDEVKKFNAEAAAMGLVLSNQDVEATRQFGIQTKELHSSLSALGITLASDIVPLLTGLAHLGTDVFTGISVGTQKIDAAAKSTSFWGGVLRDVGHDLTSIGLAAAGGPKAFNETVDKSKKSTDDAAASTMALQKAYDAYGVTLSSTDAEQIIADKSQKQLASSVDAYKTKMADTASSVGLSVTGMADDIGAAGSRTIDQFAADTKAAQDFANAVKAGTDAATASFAKDTDAVAYFSASQIASRESAAASAAKSADGIITADTRVSDAEQHVTDLQEQYAQQAADAKQAYADKVDANNTQVADSESALADTIASTNQRVLDADQKLADDRISLAQSVVDAQQRLADDTTAGQQSVHDAEQRLQDTERRQAAANNPAQLKAIDNAIALRDAKDAVTKAQAAAASKEQTDQDAIGKAQANQIKTLASDQKAADTARLDAAKSVEKAEDAVSKAKAEQNKLAAEGLTVGQETLQQQAEMRKAIEAVGAAQRTVAADAVKTTGQVSGAIAVTTDDVKKFYADSAANATTFETGIHDAIANGYDPVFISELLKEGPTEAAPIIAQIIGDQDGTFKTLVNQGQDTLDKIAAQNIETAHATQVAINSNDASVRAEFKTAMSIIEDEADKGGTLTSQNLADKLGIGVDQVRKIANDYGIALADGINPILTGVGADQIVLHAEPSTSGNPTGKFLLAGGGQVPGYGNGDTVPAMLTPGEYVLRKAAVQAIGVDALHALNAKGYATGGFVSASDVPLPPDLTKYGDKVGYAGSKTDQFAYDRVVAYLNGPGKGAATGGSAASGGPPTSTPPGQVSDWVAAGVAAAGKPDGWVPAEINIAMFESGGNPNAENDWDSNAAAGTPSKGLMQVIDPTFQRYKVPGYDDIWDPVANVAAATNYIEARYGNPSNTPGELSLARGGSYEGYELGGLVRFAKYDQGGYLEPGLTLAYNGLGHREPVGVTAGGSGGSGGGGDVIVQVTINGPALGTTARQVAEAIAEPLRAVYVRRGTTNTGNYLGRSQ